MRFFLALSIYVVPAVAFAQSNVRVTVNPGADFDSVADLLGSTIEQLEREIEQDALDALSLTNPDEYLGGIANAQGAVSRGLTADYTTNFKELMLGIGVGAALGLSDSSDDDAPINGFAPGLSVLVGVNVGDFRVFLSGFSQTLTSSTFGVEDPDFEIRLRNFALMGQYKLMGGYNDDATSYLFDWGGFDLTAGFARSTTRFLLTSDLPSDFLLGGVSGSSLATTLNSRGLLTIESKAFTIPIEVTTSVTLLSAFTFFGGLGTDIQISDTKLTASLNGDLTAVEPTTGTRLNVGSAEIVADQNADASPAAFRLLGGVQLNLWKLKVYAQGSFTPGASAGVAAGLKVAL